MPRPGRKESVLEASVQLFARKGYHGTTVRDIAEESGMLSGSLYAHITSKEDLLFEIVLRAADRFLAAIRPIAEGPGPAEERLRKAMAAHMEVMSASRDAAVVFMHEWQALAPERRTDVARLRDEYEGLLAGIIRSGVRAGEFAPVDERFARLLVLSTVNWVYQWYNPDGPLRPAQVADQFAGLILGGIRGSGSPAEVTGEGESE